MDEQPSLKRPFAHVFGEPRHGGYDRAVLEVYPSASLWARGLPHRGVDVGATLQTLEDAFDLDIREEARGQLLGSRHCFDALVAALTAREYANDNTHEPPDAVRLLYIIADCLSADTIDHRQEVRASSSCGSVELCGSSGCSNSTLSASESIRSFLEFYLQITVFSEWSREDSNP
jgi:hypothetical protein